MSTQDLKPPETRPDRAHAAALVTADRTAHRTITLEAAPESAATARMFVRAVMGVWSLEGQSDVAELLVSELATNVVRHAWPPRQIFHLTLRRGVRAGEPVLWVEVRDRDPRTPCVQEPDELGLGGRGLRLVDALADGWEVSAEPGGKCIRFHLGT